MSIISLISLAVSVIATIVYCFQFSNPGISILFVVLAVASIVLPPISKKIRLKQKKKGLVLEIIAIVIGGFNFYCIIFALTTLPIFVGFLGWVGCAIAYKLVK